MDLQKILIYTLCFLFFAVPAGYAFGQTTPYTYPSSTPNSSSTQQVGYDSQGKPIKKSSGNDTLKHRNPLEDSITLTYRYYDSSINHRLDSSINNFYNRYPVPDTYVDMGNLGLAAHSLIFSPLMKPGFDAGFHSYDIYKYTVEDSRFYTTTRPYTELSYVIGSKSEQLIQLQHTQNRNADFNFAFDFRFLNSPGEFQNQSTNHNNLRFTTNYISRDRRYGNYFIFINNKIRASENGGLQSKGALDSLVSENSLGNVIQLPVRLGNGSQYQSNFFTSALVTGTSYNESIFLFRQYYDLGQKDSLVKDTITYRLFYPRIRFQHTIEYSSNTYIYQDFQPVDSLYKQYYNYILTNDTVEYKDVWQKVSNDFSVISFPEKKNQNQYLKVGGGLEFIKGTFYPYTEKYTNIYLSGEYRNRTRDRKWDIVANGLLYVAGGYTGDYSAYISLKRELSKKVGSLEIGFNDVNRTPSFVDAQAISSFPSIQEGTFKKENIGHFFSNIYLPVVQLKLTGEYYIVNNYTYFSDQFTSQQDPNLFTVLHVGLEKTFKLSRHFTWYTDVDMQQTTGNTPVHLPLILTRNRIAFEGNFYKNLFLSTGFEVRYYSAYKADGYSPLIGQFFSQDGTVISNRPDVNLYFNFRIKSFKAFIRLENLNTLNLSSGFAFNERNFSAPLYPERALWLRIGIWWNFVN